MVDLLWVAAISVTVTIVLITINIYYTRKLGFFRLLKARKKEIITTLAWSAAIALVIIKSYSLAYATYPVLVEHGIAWTEIDQWIPRLDTLDLLLIFLFSTIAGAILLDLETVIYSFVATAVLSFVFAAVYSSFFIWHILEWNRAFPILGWRCVEYVISAAIRNIFRMAIPFVALLCLLGVLLGAFSRGIIRPSAES